MMRRRSFLAGTMAALMMVSVTGTCECPAYAQDTSDEKQYVTAAEEYVILAESGSAAAALAEDYGTDSAENENEDLKEQDQLCVLNLTEAEAEELEQDENILYIEKNIPFMLESQEEEPAMAAATAEEPKECTSSWNLDFIHADKQETGENQGKGVKIAVLDSGASLSENLNVEERIDLVGNDREDPLQLHYDVTGHGTGVAGVIASVSPEASIYSVRIFDEDNRAPLSRVAAGIQWAVDHDMDIINMSFGTAAESEILHHEIQKAYEAGILLTAAAGNTGESGGQTLYPAGYAEVMSVGSVNGLGEISDFSACRESADILAPGEGIITNGLFNGYMSVSGTSIAAPHAAGAAALLWSGKPEADKEYIRSLLEHSANKSVFQDTPGAGILDVGNAYSLKETFSGVRSPEEPGHTEISEGRDELETFDSDVIVEGCWSKENHEKLTQETASGYSGIQSKYIKLMAATAYGADVYYSIKGSAGKKFYPLHAYGIPNGFSKGDKTKEDGMNNNYVADLKYLYRLARYYFEASSVAAADAAVNKSDFSSIVQAGAQKDFLKMLVSSNKTISTVIVKDEIKHYKGIVHVNASEGIEESTPEAAGWKILGLAIHMAGDIYAHRTRVPLSSINDGKLFADLGKEAPENKGKVTYADGESHNSKRQTASKYMDEFLRNASNPKMEIMTDEKTMPCRCRSCVRAAIGRGKVEFRDLKYLLSDKNETSKNLDDSIYVYPQRYQVATRHATAQLISRFRDKSDFSIYVLLPAESTGYTLKLNNLEGYIRNTGTKWEGLTDKTKDLVQKYSTTGEI